MKNMAKSLLGLLLYLSMLFGAAALLGHFVIGQAKVEGASMSAALRDGDRVLVNKWSCRFRDLDRFDIVVFKYAYDTRTDYIKRVIGLPGETVRIDSDGRIYIDGRLLAEDYGTEPIADPGIAAEDVTLGDDEYFVLGDNRNNSSDSRDPDVGAVSRRQVKGNAWLRLWPDFGLLR